MNIGLVSVLRPGYRKHCLTLVFVIGGIVTRGEGGIAIVMGVAMRKRCFEEDGGRGRVRQRDENRSQDQRNNGHPHANGLRQSCR